MGNLIGRSDRVRQTKVYLELIAIAYIIKRWRAADADTFVGKLDAALSGWRPWQVRIALCRVLRVFLHIFRAV
jgi:hypothetical protein